MRTDSCFINYGWITTPLSFVLTADNERSYCPVVLRYAEKHRKGEIKDYPGAIIDKKGDIPNTRNWINLTSIKKK